MQTSKIFINLRDITMILIRILGVALATILLMISTANAELTAEQEREIIFDCTQLVNTYAYYRDLRDPEMVASVFTEDARMRARGQWNEGREGIEAHVRSDNPETITMHMITTVKIMPIDENNATGVSYFAVANELKGDGTRPASMQSFTAVGKYLDTFVRTEDGWKIAERMDSATFLKPGLQ